MVGSGERSLGSGAGLSGPRRLYSARCFDCDANSIVSQVSDPSVWPYGVIWSVCSLHSFTALKKKNKTREITGNDEKVTKKRPFDIKDKLKFTS